MDDESQCNCPAAQRERAYAATFKREYERMQREWREREEIERGMSVWEKLGHG